MRYVQNCKKHFLVAKKNWRFTPGFVSELQPHLAPMKLHKIDYAYLPYIYHVKTKLVLSENCMFPIPMDCHVLETTLYLQCDRYTSISNTSQSNLLTGSMGLDDVGHQRASTNLRRLRRPFCLGNVQVGLGQVWGRFSQPLFKF